MYRRIDPFRRTVLNVPGSAEYCRRDVELCLESAIEGRLGAVSDDCGDLIDFGRAGAKMIGGKVEPPWMFTGNSESRSTFYPIMRIVGAAARELLVQVAAKRLNIDATNLVVRDGIIANQASGRKLRFGALAGEAATRPVPEAPRLKSNSELKLIGRPLARLDVPGKTDGSAVFGIDVRVPGMAIAAIRRAPSPGGKLVSYDRSRILARKGVIATVEIASGLAVVADRYWTAKRALRDGKLVFAAGRLANYSTEAQRADYMQRLASGEFMIKKKSGDAASYLASADGVISAVYEIPVQAHATMEPMNCTAHVTADRCELWAPTQGMEIAHAVAKQITGLPDDRIIIHRTLLGGGFGRRLLADFVRVAIETAQAAGRPVKVIWSREEDFTYDAFRPPMTHAVRAHLGADQLPTVIAHRVVSPSHLLHVFPRTKIGAEPPWGRPIDPPRAHDGMAVEGLVETPYDIPNELVEQNFVDTPLNVSVWRTTGHGPNNFVLESFIDELAHGSGCDPLAYRLSLASKDSRAVAVLNAVAEMSEWARKAPAGSLEHGMGRFKSVAALHPFEGFAA
jgi:isoquinoline 1-oxidoreductase subunit beta